MANTYIVVGENEKIEFDLTQSSNVRGFAFTPISRCIGLFTIDQGGMARVIHIDPYTDLESVEEALKGHDITVAKMIFNPFADHAEERRKEVDSFLSKRFTMLEKVDLKDQSGGQNDSIAVLLDLNGNISDQNISIGYNNVDVNGTKYKIFPNHVGFAQINTASENLISTFCYYNRTKKLLREVGEMADVYKGYIQTALTSKTKLPEEASKYHDHGMTKTQTLKYEIAEGKRYLIKTLNTINENDEFHSSWNSWIEENKGKKLSNTIEQSLSSFYASEAQKIVPTTKKEKEEPKDDDSFLRTIEEQEQQQGEESLLIELGKVNNSKSLVKIKQKFGEYTEHCGESCDEEGMTRYKNMLRYIEILENKGHFNKPNVSPQSPSVSQLVDNKTTQSIDISQS